jgi:hypothetical protein
MYQDVESQKIANFKEDDVFAIQFDEATDITGRAQLIAFSRFVFNGDIFNLQTTPRNSKRPRHS